MTHQATGQLGLHEHSQRVEDDILKRFVVNVGGTANPGLAMWSYNDMATAEARAKSAVKSQWAVATVSDNFSPGFHKPVLARFTREKVIDGRDSHGVARESLDTLHRAIDVLDADVRFWERRQKDCSQQAARVLPVKRAELELLRAAYSAERMTDEHAPKSRLHNAALAFAHTLAGKD